MGLATTVHTCEFRGLLNKADAYMVCWARNETSIKKRSYSNIPFETHSTNLAISTEENLAGKNVHATNTASASRLLSQATSLLEATKIDLDTRALLQTNLFSNKAFDARCLE